MSLRNVTADGLICAPASDRRCAVRCIHNAPASFADALFGMWADVTAQAAYDVLEKPDVRVTNQSDKDAQLPKLLKLNEFAKKVVAGDLELDIRHPVGRTGRARVDPGM